MSFLFANSGDASTPAPPTDTRTIEVLRSELAALREKYRCKCAADEQFAMALTKAQTRNETLDNELTEAAKNIAALTLQRNGARGALVQSEEDIATLTTDRDELLEKLEIAREALHKLASFPEDTPYTRIARAAQAALAIDGKGGVT